MQFGKILPPAVQRKNLRFSKNCHIEKTEKINLSFLNELYRIVSVLQQTQFHVIYNGKSTPYLW